MIKDPIIEEVYRVRQKLMEECNGDLNELLKRLKSEELQDQHRVVSMVEVKSSKKMEYSVSKPM